jgi:hypothetical protein
MKYAKFTILVSVLMLTLVAWCVPAATQAQWTVVLPKSIDGEKVRMAAFYDENFGVWGGAGDEGMAHYTLDGGKTWTKADTSSG